MVLLSAASLPVFAKLGFSLTGAGEPVLVTSVDSNASFCDGNGPRDRTGAPAERLRSRLSPDRRRLVISFERDLWCLSRRVERSSGSDESCRRLRVSWSLLSRLRGLSLSLLLTECSLRLLRWSSLLSECRSRDRSGDRRRRVCSLS